MDNLRPTRLNLHQASRELEVSYEDGETYRLSYEYLRVYSPSAEVKGHGPGQETLQFGKKQVAIEGVQPVGNYAIKINFDDGHDSGLYSWDYLRELGENQEMYWARYLKKLEEAGLSRN